MGELPTEPHTAHPRVILGRAVERHSGGGNGAPAQINLVVCPGVAGCVSSVFAVGSFMTTASPVLLMKLGSKSGWLPHRRASAPLVMASPPIAVPTAIATATSFSSPYSLFCIWFPGWQQPHNMLMSLHIEGLRSGSRRLSHPFVIMATVTDEPPPEDLKQLARPVAMSGVLGDRDRIDVVTALRRLADIDKATKRHPLDRAATGR